MVNSRGQLSKKDLKPYKSPYRKSFDIGKSETKNAENKNDVIQKRVTQISQDATEELLNNDGD